MTDLHCHILPHMDDGAKTCDDSIALIKLELQNGIDRIAVTPHFNFSRSEDIDEFCERRDAAHKKLSIRLSAMNIDIPIINGAEVFLSPKIVMTNSFEKLAYDGTNYMLTELPTDHFYDWIPDVLYKMRSFGITPVIAHVERYGSVLAHPDRLYDMAVSGCVIQINAGCIVRGTKRLRTKIYDLISHNLIHVIATDTHSVDHRPPMIKKALKILSKKFGHDIVKYFSDNSNCIIENREVDVGNPEHVTHKRVHLLKL